MTYKGATGHDNEAGFTTFVQQPACPRGIQYPAYIHAASGLVYPDGSPFCVWEWVNVTESQYETILAALGLTTIAGDTSGLVTIETVTHDRSTFADYNATCFHRKGEDTEFVDNLFRTVRFTFKQLEAT